MVLKMMESSLKRQNLNLLFEPDVCDALYILLTRKEFSVIVKERVLKVSDFNSFLSNQNPTKT